MAREDKSEFMGIQGEIFVKDIPWLDVTVKIAVPWTGRGCLADSRDVRLYVLFHD